MMVPDSGIGGSVPNVIEEHLAWSLPLEGRHRDAPFAPRIRSKVLSPSGNSASSPVFGETSSQRRTCRLPHRTGMLLSAAEQPQATDKINEHAGQLSHSSLWPRPRPGKGPPCPPFGVSSACMRRTCGMPSAGCTYDGLGAALGGRSRRAASARGARGLGRADPARGAHPGATVGGRLGASELARLTRGGGRDSVRAPRRHRWACCPNSATAPNGRQASNPNRPPATPRRGRRPEVPYFLLRRTCAIPKTTKPRMAITPASQVGAPPNPL